MSVKPGRLGELAWSGASNRNPTAHTRVGRLRIGPVLAIVLAAVAGSLLWVAGSSLPPSGSRSGQGRR